MESSLSVKARPLSAVTCSPIYCPLSVRTIGIMGCAPIGDGYGLRLQWRGFVKLPVRYHSRYRALLKASMESPPDLVVASAAAFSAVTVLFFNYSSKQFDMRQISGRLAHLFYEQMRAMVSWIIGNVNHVDLKEKEAVIHLNPLLEETGKTLKECDKNDLDLVLGAHTEKEAQSFTETNLEKEIPISVSLCDTLSSNEGLSSPTESLESINDGRTVGTGIIGQSFFCQQKDSRNRRELRMKKTKSFQDRGPASRSPIFGPKEHKHNNDNHNPSWQLRVYNQLLREGRLNDCIELLEDLEEKGSLDMDKVYHMRFFEACRKQKATKEAIRFTKLISNPTLSTFNMLMSVCTSSQDSEGAFQVLQYVEEAGLKADCKLYTTLISTCAKSGKVDIMFKVFHEMVNAGVEPNLHTYGALIDGCAKAGQVAKAFGAYGILRSKNVKPDRVVFNALISACGQSGAMDRAFDVLAEMRAEAQPIDPDHITIGALMKACAGAGEIDRAKGVYHLIHKYGIHGTAELYTIALNSCCHDGDWEFACSVYDDMIKNGVEPDEIFISALIDVAGHARKVDAAFEILHEAKAKGMRTGVISYGSLMGACSNAGDWQKALDLYEDIKGLNMKPTVPMFNALITALCEGDQLNKAIHILSEMREVGLCPNTITYSVLVVASEKKDDIDSGVTLISQAKKDGVALNLIMCRCLISMCLKRFQSACQFAESVLSLTTGKVQLNSKWTSLALMVYRETINSGAAPTVEELSQVLGCLQLPLDASVRSRLTETLGVKTNISKGANLCALIDGFGEYDPRALYLMEEASSRGVIPLISFKESPIIVDVRNLQVHTAEVYILTVLKGLKYRLAAGAKVPNVSIFVPVLKTQIQTSAGEKTVSIASRVSQAVAALLRRLGLSYIGNESYGKIRINGVTIRRWFQPKLESGFRENAFDLNPSLTHLSSGISRQQLKIRTSYFSVG